MSERIFIFDETPDSGASTIQPPSYTLKYLASGEPNQSIVEGYAIAASPALIFTSQGALYRQDVRLEPDGFARFIATVPYGPQQKDTGSVSFSFDTTGATIKIKAAKEHITAYDADGEDTSNVHHGAIGVTNDLKVEGCDIIVPALKLSYTFKHPQGVVSEIFAKGLARATGQTNANPWRTFDVGEALFIGATGGGGTDTAAEVTYNIICSENADGDLTIGGISGIVKSGHAFAWVEFKDETEGGEPAVQPKRVNIERVYDAIDFYEWFGWE